MGMADRSSGRVDQDCGDTSGISLRGARRSRTTKLLEAW
jgi:hypothetical protein